MEDKIKDISISFFDKLWVHYSDLNIVKQDKNIYLIKIITDESPLVIWSHWRNLEAIESIIKLIISTKNDEKIKLHLEVNDYIHSKDEKLKKYVISKVDFAIKINKDIRLNKLNPYERKKAHWFIWELNNENIYTESRWEWTERRLFICIRDKELNKTTQIKTNDKLTIDLDWDNI